MRGYLARLNVGRYVLWCYFVWWAVVAVRYFDPNPRIWLTSLGLSGIIGAALWLNTTRSGPVPIRIGAWPTLRLFMMPFGVSSFAALVKDRGFFLIFSPRWEEMAVAVGICAFLGLAACLARVRERRSL